MSEESIKRFGSLDLPGFYIPKPEELQQRATLDRFLSQALRIPLTQHEPDDSQRLSCIDDNRFVLTLDFTLKLLNIHERVACHIPCIIEGETGVSKTALTKMYTIMRNSSLNNHAHDETQNSLALIVEALTDDYSCSTQKEDLTLDVLRNMLIDETDGTMTGSYNLGKRLSQLIIEKVNERSGIFQDMPEHEHWVSQE